MKTHKPTHNSWASMIARCYRPGTKGYENYGGKDIGVCERWRGPSGYQNFLADMGERPPGLTLDRKDNAIGYTPGNCQWSTWLQQAANRRSCGPLGQVDPDSLRQKALATPVGIVGAQNASPQPLPKAA